MLVEHNYQPEQPDDDANYPGMLQPRHWKDRHKVVLEADENLLTDAEKATMGYHKQFIYPVGVYGLGGNRLDEFEPSHIFADRASLDAMIASEQVTPTGLLEAGGLYRVTLDDDLVPRYYQRSLIGDWWTNTYAGETYAAAHNDPYIAGSNDETEIILPQAEHSIVSFYDRTFTRDITIIPYDVAYTIIQQNGGFNTNQVDGGFYSYMPNGAKVYSIGIGRDTIFSVHKSGYVSSPTEFNSPVDGEGTFGRGNGIRRNVAGDAYRYYTLSEYEYVQVLGLASATGSIKIIPETGFNLYTADASTLHICENTLTTIQILGGTPDYQRLKFLVNAGCTLTIEVIPPASDVLIDFTGTQVISLSFTATAAVDMLEVFNMHGKWSFTTNNYLKYQYELVDWTKVDKVGSRVRDLQEWLFGTDTDNTHFEGDGTLVMEGAATVHDDMLAAITAVAVQGTGVTQNSTEQTIDFATNANLADYAWTSYQLSHRWMLNSVIKPHIHWEQANNNLPNFLVQYRWQPVIGQKVTSWTDYACNTPAATYIDGTLNNICHGAGITPPVGANISDILQIRVLRDNANTSGVFVGADSYAGTVRVTSMDVHIQIDTIGSRNEFTK